jgi:hypothetical protein
MLIRGLLLLLIVRASVRISHHLCVHHRVCTQGRLKVRHKAAGAGMLVPFSSGLLASLGPAFCQY